MASIEEMSFYSSESSPDPLSKSIDRLYPPSSPLKRTRDVTEAPALRESSLSLPRGSSPNKSRRTSPVKNNDAIPLEQSQSIVFHTPNKLLEGVGAAGSSPWKIRVTVEAEPEDQDESEDAPRTMTMTVPLKGEDEHNRVRRRPRLRKSVNVGFPAPAQEEMDEAENAAVTPRRITRRSIHTTATTIGPEDALLDTVAIMPTIEVAGVTPSRRRGRPPKSAKTTGDGLLMVEEPLSAASIPKRTTRMSFAALTPLHEKRENAHMLDSSALFTPATQKRAKVAAAASKIRDRVPTPRKPAGYDDSILSPLPASSPPRTSQENADAQYAIDDDISAVVDDSANNEAVFTSDVEQELEEEDNMMTGMEDDTSNLDRSAVESEGFSMVSIDSLRNQRIAAEKRIQDSTRSTSHPFSPSKDEITSRSVTVDQRSTRRSKRFPSPVKESPNRRPQQVVVAVTTNVTTDAQQQLPDLGEPQLSATSNAPSDPDHIERNTLDMTSTDLNPIPPLQNTSDTLLHPVSKYPIRKPRSSRKRKPTGDLFSPFGDGTKRQLRAGLVMGELLARGTKGFLQDAAGTHANGESVETLEDRVESAVAIPAYPRLPTPAESIDSNSGDATQPRSQPIAQKQNQSPRVQAQEQQTFLSSPPTSHSYENSDEVEESRFRSPNGHQEPSELSRTQHLEQVFHQERQEVVRQIQEANTSQVIVINSDAEEGQDSNLSHNDHKDQQSDQDLQDEQNQQFNSHHQSDEDQQGDADQQHDQHEEEEQPILPDAATLADIWQEEADRSLDSSHATRNDRRKRKHHEVEEKTPELRDLFVEDLGPPRAKIPRTWRRASGNDFLYSDEVETPARPSAEDKVTSHATETAMGQSPAHVSRSEIPDVEEKQEAAIPPLPKLSKGILSNPFTQPVVQRSPPKEVHFSNVLQSRTQSDHDVYEEKSSLSKNSPAEDADKTFYGNHEEVCRSNSSEDSSLLQTSDVRQLKTELNASAKRVGSSAVVNTQHSSVLNQSNEENEHSVLRPDGNRKYAPLFGEKTTPQKSITPAAAPLKQNPSRRLPTHDRATTTTNSLPHAAIPSLQPQTQPQPQPTLLTRLTTWLFTPSLSTSTTTTAPHKPNSNRLPWNRNHYLLLDHYWRLSLNPLHPGPPLPPSYSAPRASLPTDLTRHVKNEIHSNGGRHAGIVEERWVRVAWAFMEVARAEGVPLLSDGDLDGKHDVEEEGGYPKRDENGRVIRVKEVWGSWDVLRRVYGLWVRDNFGSGAST